MVDLVKVRKKAKEKAAQKAEGSRQKAEGKEQKAKEQNAEVQPEPAAAAESAATQRSGDRATQKTKEVAAAPEPSVTRQPDDPAARIAKFVAGAGKRRETGKQQEAEPAKAQIELLTFELAGEQYAIDIEHLVEIVTPRPVTRVPNADPSIVGILSLRGMIVTLIDVRARLRHRAAEATGPDVRIIVTEYDGENTGFVVDRVLRVVKADAEEIDPHPVVHTSEQDESVRGVFRNDGALTILLDLEKLLGVVRNGTYV